MYWLYALGVMAIVLSIVDLVYFLQKKYAEYLSRKSGQNREFKGIAIYLGAFLLGALLRILFFAKDVTFLILLKDSILFGMLAFLIIANIKVIKNRLIDTKREFANLKNIEKSDGSKLFSKKNKKDDNEA
jgi:hypothetical protein